MFTASSPEGAGEWFAHLNFQRSSQSQWPIEFLVIMLCLEEMQGNSGCRMTRSVRLYRHVSTLPLISTRTFTKSGIYAVGERHRSVSGNRKAAETCNCGMLSRSSNYRNAATTLTMYKHLCTCKTLCFRMSPWVTIRSHG